MRSPIVEYDYEDDALRDRPFQRLKDLGSLLVLACLFPFVLALEWWYEGVSPGQPARSVWHRLPVRVRMVLAWIMTRPMWLRDRIFGEE